jgi:hypothetical protein
MFTGEALPCHDFSFSISMVAESRSSVNHSIVFKQEVSWVVVSLAATAENSNM